MKGIDKMKKKILVFTIGIFAAGVLTGCSNGTDIKNTYSDETEKVNQVDDEEVKSSARKLSDYINSVMQIYEADVETESIEGSVPDSIDVSVEYGNIVNITDVDEELESRIQGALGQEYKDYEKIDISISKRTETEFIVKFEVTVTIDDVTVSNNV